MSDKPNNQKKLFNLISELSGQANILTVPKVYIRAMGSIDGGLLLSQMIYWSDKGKREDGYFYKTYAEWEDETTLSKYEVSKNVAIMVSAGFLQTIIKKANGAPTVHYKFSFDEFQQWIVKKLDNGIDSFLTNDDEKTSQSLTETYSETYSETIISEATPQPPTPKSKKPVKPKEEQPPKPEAVKVYKSVLCRWPNKALDNIIGDTVGNDPEALILWENVIRGWIATGWNPGNVKGMLECFGRREIPGTHKPNGNGKNGNGNGNGITAKQAANKTANEAMRYAWNFKKHCYYDTWEMVDLTEEEYQNAMSKM